MFGLAFLTPALLRIIAIGCAIAALVVVKIVIDGMLRVPD